MKTENYVKAIERLREVNVQMGCAIAQLLGAIKGEAFNTQNLPELHFMLIRAEA